MFQEEIFLCLECRKTSFSDFSSHPPAPTLHSYPLSHLFQSYMQTIIMCISFHAVYNHTAFFCIENRCNSFPFLLLLHCNPSCCLVLPHWFLPEPQQSNGNTIACTWHPFKSPAKVLIGSDDFLAQQLVGNCIGTAMCFFWNGLCLTASTIQPQCKMLVEMSTLNVTKRLSLWSNPHSASSFFCPSYEHVFFLLNPLKD